MNAEQTVFSVEIKPDVTASDFRVLDPVALDSLGE